MKVSRFGYILQMVAVASIILIAGIHQLPNYTNRLIILAVFAVIDMRYWFSIKKYFTLPFKKGLTILYWLPLFLLLLFFVAGVITPYTQWPSLSRIYFPGILLVFLMGKGIFLMLVIALDFFIIPLNVIRHINPENIQRLGRWYRPRIFLLTALGMASAMMMIYFSGMIFWVDDYKLTTVELQVKNLPEEFNGYKVIQMSDMHLGGFLTSKPLDRIIKIVNDQHPDVILFTGDMVNFTTDEVYFFENDMKKFTAKDGIYSILGNHDYGEYSRWESQEAKDLNDQELFDFYKRIGWRLLRNENVTIMKDSASIAILGVENWSLSKRFGKKGDLRKTFAGTESTPFKILMTHDPSHWNGEVNTLYPEIDLTLSGHTHAFQFAIETASVKWSPASFLFREWGGLYEKVHENGSTQYLYVNRGAGTLGYPGRIFTRPEITLIILQKAD